MGEPISLDEALARIRQAADTLLDLQSVPLLSARGRRLAQDYHADVPWPVTDRSAMDGYALRAGSGRVAAGTRLRVAGVALAGHPFAGDVGDGEAIRIMTGAVVPGCVDTVVPVECTSGYSEVGTEFELREPIDRGANIRRVGSEVAVGDLLLAAGTRIGAAEIGTLAALGVDPVPVFCQPVVAILATGDEVVAIHRVPAPHQVRNSNAYALAAQIAACGAEPRLLGIAGDREEDLRERLTGGLDQADVLLTIGGVSKGTHDLVHGILEELGVAPVFHGVRLKPGKPVFFGCRLDAVPKEVTHLRQKTFVFGLPGNPASAFTVFDLLVRPLLDWLCGAPDELPQHHVRVAGVPFRANRRVQAVPARLRSAADGSFRAELGASTTSGDPFGLCGMDGYAILPADAAPSAGLVVPFVPYSDRA